MGVYRVLDGEAKAAVEAPPHLVTSTHDGRPGEVTRISQSRNPPAGGGHACALWAGEHQMDNAVGRADRLQVLAMVEFLESVPEAFSAAEHHRHDRNVDMVDEVGARKYGIVDGPPPIRTSRPPAASLATSRCIGRLEEGEECGVHSVSGWTGRSESWGVRVAGHRG